VGLNSLAPFLMRNPITIGGYRNPKTIGGNRNPVTIRGNRNPVDTSGIRNPVTIVSVSDPVTPPAVTYYVLAGGAGNQDGSSWANAWASLDDVDGLSGGGNIIEIGSLVDNTEYDISDWQPVGGLAGNPNIYRIAQDGTHSHTIVFNATGTQLLNGVFTNVTLDGRYLGQNKFIVHQDFQYILFIPGGSGYEMNLKLYGFTSTESIIFCYGWNVEIGYCNIAFPLSGLDDSGIQHLGDDDPSPTWGKNSIHHSVITVKRAKLTGSGWDAVKWGQGVDVYNNSFLSVYDAGYVGSQHNDAIQASGNYWRVYNNYFENFLSYVFLNEIFDSSDAAHYRLYNNIIFYSDEVGVDWTAQAIFAFGGNGGTTPSASLTDVICANNTAIGVPDGIKGSFFCHLYPAINPPVGADCYFINNCANNFTPITQVGSGVTSNNISDLSVSEVVSLALYPAGDFHPTALSIAIIDAGLNPAPAYLTSAFTTDADGISRANPWDIGAYISNFPPPSSVTETFSLLPDSSNFSDIDPEGWTLHTGDFRTGSGGTSGMVSSNAAAIVSIASYQPSGFTTSSNHTVEVTLGTPAGSSAAQGAAAAIQSDGTAYHVFVDAGGSAFLGYVNGSGTGSDYITIVVSNVSKLRIVVSGTGVSRRVTASYDNGSGWVTPPTWTSVDFGVGKRLDSGFGGIAGFNNAAAQYIDSVTISNN